MERRLSLSRSLSGEIESTLKLAVSAVRGMVVGTVEESSLVRLNGLLSGDSHDAIGHILRSVFGIIP